MSSDVMTRLRKPYAVIKKEFLVAVSYKFDFTFRLLGIWMSVFLYYFIAKLINPALSVDLEPYGGDYFLFVIIGTAFSGYLSVGLESFSTSIREMQLMGTLEAILVTRTRFTTVLVYQAFWNFLFASLHVFAYVGFALLFLGVKFENPDWFAASVILVLTIISFSSLGIISGSFILVLKKGTPVNWVINGVFRLIGGVFYPVSVLPEWCRALSYALPITHSLEGIRYALIRGYSVGDLRQEVLALSAFAALLFPLSILCFNAAFNKARNDGTLCQY